MRWPDENDRNISEILGIYRRNVNIQISLKFSWFASTNTKWLRLCLYCWLESWKKKLRRHSKWVEIALRMEYLQFIQKNGWNRLGFWLEMVPKTASIFTWCPEEIQLPNYRDITYYFLQKYAIFNKLCNLTKTNTKQLFTTYDRLRWNETVKVTSI